MKAVLIDDEPKALQVLTILLQENCKEIEKISKAENLLDGVALIKSEQPDLVFLDIEMPEHSGLEIFDFIDKSDYHFDLIFTTAYNAYAIQAFDLSAIAYLLKPLRASQVIDAVHKVIKQNKQHQINKQLHEIKHIVQQVRLKKIGLPHSNGVKFVNYHNIILMKASGMYTEVYTTDEEILVSKPLKHFSQLLAQTHLFYKPHRSYLINLHCIAEYVKKDGGYIVLENGRTVSVSHEKKEEFLSIIHKL